MANNEAAPLSLQVSLSVSHEMLRLIAEIDEFKGRWEALQTLSPERLRALRHVATIESIGSSTRIEGVKLTDHQTLSEKTERQPCRQIAARTNPGAGAAAVVADDSEAAQGTRAVDDFGVGAADRSEPEYAQGAIAGIDAGGAAFKTRPGEGDLVYTQGRRNRLLIVGSLIAAFAFVLLALPGQGGSYWVAGSAAV